MRSQRIPPGRFPAREVVESTRGGAADGAETGSWLGPFGAGVGAGFGAALGFIGGACRGTTDGGDHEGPRDIQVAVDDTDDGLGDAGGEA